MPIDHLAEREEALVGAGPRGPVDHAGMEICADVIRSWRDLQERGPGFRDRGILAPRRKALVDHRVRLASADDLGHLEESLSNSVLKSPAGFPPSDPEGDLVVDQHRGPGVDGEVPDVLREAVLHSGSLSEHVRLRDASAIFAVETQALMCTNSGKNSEVERFGAVAAGCEAGRAGDPTDVVGPPAPHRELAHGSGCAALGGPSTGFTDRCEVTRAIESRSSR